ncbi:MAG TPA: GGDEF domain-containing protein [Nitrospinota bacterium]|jgi:diguanylate cyclase (GGDEF)-like protein|nr:GGDEF domain-containing protein [Nitrospinota bacterium]
MKKKLKSLDAGCDAILDEFLKKGTEKAHWIVLDEMVADIQKLNKALVSGQKIYTSKQVNAIKHVIDNALEKRTEIKNLNLSRSARSAKESILLTSTRVQVLLATMKFSSCHTADEAVGEIKKINKVIVDSIKEYADVYEIDIAGEIKKVEADLDVIKSLNLLISVFRRAIDTLLFSLSISLEAKREEANELNAIENTLTEGVTKNDIKPKFHQMIANLTKSLVHKMQKNIAAQQKEIDDLKTSKAELEKLLTIDELTEISSRRSYEERFDLEIKRMKRNKSPLYLLISDIDDFKRINDIYGHKTGDAILKAVAQALKSSIRGIDFIARWGGEEFVVLCPETNEKGAVNVAEKLRKTVETHEFTANYKVSGEENVVKKERIHITISVGVVEVEEGEDVGTAFNKADKAMYEAKEKGKNKVVFC